MSDSLRVTLLDPARREEWNRFAETSPGALSWHGYDWASFLARHYRVTFFPLAAVDGDEIRGILPLYRIRTLRTGTMLVSIPYFVAGGIATDDDEARRLLVDATLALSERNGSAPILLKQYGVASPGPFRTDSSYFNRELDVSRGVEIVRAELAPANLTAIEESAERPLALEYPSSRIREFHDRLAAHEHALGRPWISRRWLESLLATGLYRPAVLTSADTVVAGTLVKRYKDTVSFPLTWLPTGGARVEADGYRLYWELIGRLARDGVRIVHSGRIPDSGDVPGYRLGWGGTMHRYHYQHYPAGGQTDAESRSGGSVRGRFERVWRRIPRPLAAAVSPVIVKQFP